MKFWNLLAFVEDDQLIESAIFSEAVGFDAVGVSDHIFIPERIESRYPASPDGKPFFTIDHKWSFPDPWVSLAMIAGATSRIKLMQSIYVLSARNPMEVARATGTLAVLSNHRLYVCGAVGWMKEEFDTYGVDFATRGKRADEMIAVMRKLWSGEIVEHHGTHFNFDRLRMLPAPGHVPIIAAGPSPAVMKRAAYLCDGWMDGGNKVDDMPHLIASLTTMRREAGREHLPFEIIMVLKGDWDTDSFKRAEGMGVTAIQLAPAFFLLHKRSTLDEKKRLWEDFAEKVIRHFPGV
ncbi:TIGR03619 family F420-dependent LLM class oxidoreductase [Sphingobium sp. AN558]|uniref:TIGR03619 family F420-dependent LLM class oxidoreductase n=1 Tax=Sphingobium sp. AN558 TaxID=3133442 RepID=UPI0030C1B492